MAHCGLSGNVHRAADIMVGGAGSRTQTNKPLDQSSSGFLLPKIQHSKSSRGSHVEAPGAQIQAGRAVESQCWERCFIQPPDFECKAAPLLKGRYDNGRGEFTD